MRFSWTGLPAASRRRTGKRRADRPDSGFTLVETLVAFAVAVMLLGAVMELFSTALRSGSDANALARATLIAQSALDGFRATSPVAEGETSGVVDGTFERRITVKRRRDLEHAPIARRGAGSTSLPAYEITVEVEWQRWLGTRKLALSTVRLGAPQ